MNCTSCNSGAHPDCAEHLAHLAESIEQILNLLGRQRRRPADPLWLSWHEAAAVAGLSVEALRTRVRRSRGSVEGLDVRVRHGGIFKTDFERLMHSWEKQPGRGAIARESLQNLQQGRG
ncbi:MAG: hypothetical protein NTX50_22090 [Candidatus Sumerlaeota bacterium]|nr:hypothetical protein [Candidatus Sumerlaeota bacterium]